MQLEDYVNRDRHIWARLVNKFHNIPVTGNFLFRAIERCRSVLDQRFDSSWRRRDAFEAIRGVGRFYGRLDLQALKCPKLLF